MHPVGLAIQLEHTSAQQALKLAQASQQAGHWGVMAADVSQPWVPGDSQSQGQAPAMWNVLSALGSHSRGPLGAVITPNFRHHPLVIAQDSATLACLYPNRHWLALSAGEAVNDALTGQHWPRPPERINAMFEAAVVVRKLFTQSAAGKDTRFHGRYVTVDGARLWSLPPQLPKVLVAAAGPLTARRAGREADGFITMGNSLDKAQLLLQRFHMGVKESNRDVNETLKVARLHVSWATSQEQAISQALKLWPQAAMRFNISDIRSPFDIAQIAKLVRVEDFESNLLITTQIDQVRTLVQQYYELGFDQVYVHNVGGESYGWFEDFRMEW